MRRLLLVLFILIVPCTPFAAEPGTGQEIIGSKDILRGRFVEERNLKGFKGPVKSTGHFVVAPQRGLIWGMEKPFPTTTVITPAGLVQSVGGTKIMSLPAQKIPFMLHLYDMLGGALAGNWQALEQDFTVAHSGDTLGWQVVLTPRQTGNAAMPFSSITVSGSRFVEQAVLLKPDGDSDTLTFLDEVIAPMPPTSAETGAFNSVHP